MFIISTVCTEQNLILHLHVHAMSSQQVVAMQLMCKDASCVYMPDC